MGVPGHARRPLGSRGGDHGGDRDGHRNRHDSQILQTTCKVSQDTQRTSPEERGRPALGRGVVGNPGDAAPPHTHTSTYIHTHTHTYIHKHTYAHTHLYTNTHIPIHTPPYTHTHTNAHIYTQTHTPPYTNTHPKVVAYTFDPRTWEVEAGGCLNSRPVCST